MRPRGRPLTLRPGPRTMRRMKTLCPDCGRPVRWAETADGKRLTLDSRAACYQVLGHDRAGTLFAELVPLDSTGAREAMVAHLAVCTGRRSSATARAHLELQELEAASTAFREAVKPLVSASDYHRARSLELEAARRVRDGAARRFAEGAPAAGQADRRSAYTAELEARTLEALDGAAPGATTTATLAELAREARAELRAAVRELEAELPRLERQRGERLRGLDRRELERHAADLERELEGHRTAKRGPQ